MESTKQYKTRSATKLTLVFWLSDPFLLFFAMLSNTSIKYLERRKRPHRHAENNNKASDKWSRPRIHVMFWRMTADIYRGNWAPKGFLCANYSERLSTLREIFLCCVDELGAITTLFGRGSQWGSMLPACVYNLYFGSLSSCLLGKEVVWFLSFITRKGNLRLFT